MTNEELADLAHELNTQDNRIIAHPLYCVYERSRIYGVDADISDGIAWVYEEDPYRIREIEDVPEDEVESYCARMESEGYIQVYYKTVPRFLIAHLTNRAAETYISRYGHEYKHELYIYVSSLVGCSEMIRIREHLMSPLSEDTSAQSATMLELRADLKRSLLREELAEARGAQQTHEWYAARLSALYEWARAQDEDIKNQFFGIIANARTQHAFEESRNRLAASELAAKRAEEELATLKESMDSDK